MANEPIIGANSGKKETVLAFAKKSGAKRYTEVVKFVDEVYRIAGVLKWDAFLICAQSAVETANWTSFYWDKHLNPGGLGITYDGEASKTWKDGTEAARALLVHHSAYVLGALPDVLKDYKALDQRYDAVFAAKFNKTVKEWDDYGNGKWAVDPHYYQTIIARRSAMRLVETGGTDAKLIFGLVPHPTYQRRTIDNSTAWNDLGQRRIVGTCVHRMEGTLVGTDGYFRGEAKNKSLTDYGIGGAKDGANDGVIYMWNDPRGRRAPWANGAANDLDDDGIPFVKKLGVNAVNRDLVSIELSGFYDKEKTPVTPKQFESLCQLAAYWHDQAQVPWYDFPHNPNVGVVTQMYHYEFAQKGCPGPVVIDMTPKFHARVKEIMRAHQEQKTPPKPEPEPKPQTKTPVRSVVLYKGSKYYRVGNSFGNGRVIAVNEASTLRKRASTDSEDMGSVKKDDRVRAKFWTRGDEVDGENIWWVLGSVENGARLWSGATASRPQ